MQIFIGKQSRAGRFILKVEQALRRLPEKERELITMRYLQNDSEYEKDQNVYGTMQISADTYSKIRNRAFYKLMYMFSMNVGQEDGKPNE